MGLPTLPFAERRVAWSAHPTKGLAAAGWLTCLPRTPRGRWSASKPAEHGAVRAHDSARGAGGKWSRAGHRARECRLLAAA